MANDGSILKEFLKFLFSLEYLKRYERILKKVFASILQNDNYNDGDHIL